MYEIKKINWLSKEIKEAEVYICDGKYSIVVFSHPFDRKTGEIISELLYTLNADNIKISVIKEFCILRVSNSFSYNIVGIINNMDENHIKVGSFIIELDVNLPNDLRKGDFISFTCDRIDLYNQTLI